MNKMFVTYFNETKKNYIGLIALFIVIVLFDLPQHFNLFRQFSIINNNYLDFGHQSNISLYIAILFCVAYSNYLSFRDEKNKSSAPSEYLIPKSSNQGLLNKYSSFAINAVIINISYYAFLTVLLFSKQAISVIYQNLFLKVVLILLWMLVLFSMFTLLQVITGKKHGAWVAGIGGVSLFVLIKYYIILRFASDSISFITILGELFLINVIYSNVCMYLLTATVIFIGLSFFALKFQRYENIGKWLSMTISKGEKVHHV